MTLRASFCRGLYLQDGRVCVELDQGFAVHCIRPDVVARPEVQPCKGYDGGRQRLHGGFLRNKQAVTL